LKVCLGMFTQPTLSTTRLVLRTFVIGDAAAVQRLAGVHEIAFTTLHVPHPYKDGMAAAWIRTHAYEDVSRCEILKTDS
jgi:[ribosomal protein S5]-alanine N-acetyltransferase